MATAHYLLHTLQFSSIDSSMHPKIRTDVLWSCEGDNWFMVVGCVNSGVGFKGTCTDKLMIEEITARFRQTWPIPAKRSSCYPTERPNSQLRWPEAVLSVRERVNCHRRRWKCKTRVVPSAALTCITREDGLAALQFWQQKHTSRSVTMDINNIWD